MKIKCVSSNIGTINVPGKGQMTFAGNCLYIVPDEIGSYLRGFDPKSFKYVDNSQPKSGDIVVDTAPEKRSYTNTIKSTLGFTNTAVNSEDVDIKNLEDN